MKQRIINDLSAFIVSICSCTEQNPLSAEKECGGRADRVCTYLSARLICAAKNATQEISPCSYYLLVQQLKMRQKLLL